MQILIYFFIGTVAALVNLGVFGIMLNCTRNADVAIVVSYAASALTNYLLCIAILFRHKARWTTGGEILAYIFTLVIMGGIDYLVTLGLIHWLRAPMWGKLLASLAGFAGNYLLRRHLVFPLRKKQ